MILHHEKEENNMSCNTNSLSAKEVISVCDGKRLGHICNYEIDLICGTVTAVFVPADRGIFSFGKQSDIRIPWDKIKKIGEDTILAEVPPKVTDCTLPRKHRFRQLFD